MKIVIAPDKFKGCLSAVEAADSIGEGFKSVWADARCELFPIADGGEGTAEVLCEALGGRWVSMSARDPLGRPNPVRLAWNGAVAAFEMNEAAGLRLLSAEERDPLKSNTYGIGEMIRQAIALGAQRIIVGLGGSATNDGGIGMAAALGFEFLDEFGNPLQPLPKNFLRIQRINRPKSALIPEVLAAVDVRNPLLGERGASRTYGPQKGADPGTVEDLELGMSHLVDIVQRDLEIREREVPGDGAAGGLGFGLRVFCNAEIRKGFDLVTESMGIEEAIRNCDFVATGEGAVDHQTLEGKGPAGVAAMARKHGRPCVVFAGTLHDDPRLDRVFDAMCTIIPSPMTLGDALGNAQKLLRAAARRFARAVEFGELTRIS